MARSKKANLWLIILNLIIIFISSCGRVDYYEAPVYLNIISTGSLDPQGGETKGADIARWYKPGATAVYYPMKANFTIEAISAYEPAIDSMKPKGVTLNKIIMKYYPQSNAELGNPAFVITKWVSYFIPVTKEANGGTTASSQIKMQQEEGAGEEKGVSFALEVGDEGTERLFTSGIGGVPRDGQYYWILKCELEGIDERGNQVRAEKYLYLNCNARIFEEEE
ncbi:hypothetical protein KKB84_09135 [bacterium]|nr:hypothetical protein [bacterium]MBU1154102.1 hypothetical protein [bacterium]MBU1782476.1 hypothetical protein [bacterium]MBU2599971.1 hypothetical protein [bacterium]